MLKEQINNEQSPADQANKELESAKAEIEKLKSRVEEAEAQVKLKEAVNKKIREIANKEANRRIAD